MAKMNPSYYLLKLGSNSPAKQGLLSCKEVTCKSGGNNLFNLKSFNSLKKDQTNLKLFKNSSFDSSFNSVQSLNINLSHILPLHAQQQTQAGAEPASHSCEAVAEAVAGIGSEGGVGLRAIPANHSSDLQGVRGSCYSHSCPSHSCGGDGIICKNIKYPKISAILRAIRSIRLNRDEWKLIRYIKLIEKKINTRPSYLSPAPLEQKLGVVNKNFYIKQNNKNFTYTNIISKNLLLQNMKYNFLKSTLSSILKKKIRSISEILEDKPIKNYVLYSYLKNCISLGTPPHLNGGRTKLSLNKYKGRKFGSFIYYNKIIDYKFNSTPFTAVSEGVTAVGVRENHLTPLDTIGPAGEGSKVKSYPAKQKEIKDTYKLLFYLFKSMYCLISKPVLKYTNDKVTIQLFYYLNIPKKKVFRLFSISYINSIKNKWLALIEKKKTNYINPSSPQLGQL